MEIFSKDEDISMNDEMAQQTESLSPSTEKATSLAYENKKPGGVYWFKIDCLSIVVESTSVDLQDELVVVQVGKTGQSEKTNWRSFLSRCKTKKEEWAKIARFVSPPLFPLVGSYGSMNDFQAELQRDGEKFPAIGGFCGRNHGQRKVEISEPWCK